MKFKVGDLAITQNSSVPEWNDRQLVVVRQINPSYVEHGITYPYLVTRVDGQPFGWVGNGAASQFFKAKQAWCREIHLCKPEDCDLLEEWQVYSRPDECEIAVFNAYEQAVRMLSQQGGA